VDLENPVTLVNIAAKRCPPCELKGENSNTTSKDLLDTISSSAKNPIVSSIQVKVSSAGVGLCTQFQFDLDNGDVTMEVCPPSTQKLNECIVFKGEFKDVSAVPQELPNFALPENCV